MPLDVLGHTRATLTKSASMSYAERCGESFETSLCWGLIFEILDHEQRIPSKRKSAVALITSLPFVHTARRYYRLNGLVRSLDSRRCGGDTRSGCGEAGQTVSFRGSKSHVRGVL